MPPLKNDRYERYCQELVQGCTQMDAARRAGFKVAADRSRGSRLAQRDDIRGRMAELREEMTSEITASVIERKIKLSGLIRDPDTRPGILIAAIAEMNRMEGSYAPAKIETDSRSVTIKRIIVHEPYAPGEAKIKPYEELPALPGA
jgi:hypothetical protein